LRLSKAVICSFFNSRQCRFWDLQFRGSSGVAIFLAWGHRTILSLQRIQDLGTGYNNSGGVRWSGGRRSWSACLLAWSIFIKLYINFGLFGAWYIEVLCRYNKQVQLICFIINFIGGRILTGGAVVIPAPFWTAPDSRCFDFWLPGIVLIKSVHSAFHIDLDNFFVYYNSMLVYNFAYNNLRFLVV